MTVKRARWLVAFVAVSAFLNSLGNGFAYDDNQIVRFNPVVTEGRWGEAAFGPYWRNPAQGTGLYRPVTIAAFAAEWHLWKGSTLGFHAVNVAGNAAVSLLVLALLLRFVSLPGALAGALFFAVHPVHVEAAANLVGEAELWAAGAFLLACLLYLDGAEWTGWRHVARLVGLSALYLVGLGAKEIAATLPAVLVLLELFRRSDVPLRRRIFREVPVYAGLAAVMGGYLLMRWSVLGTVVGEVPAPTLLHLSTGQRILTAVSVWPQYLRLMAFPRTLSADYAPAVLVPATSVNMGVVLGAVVLVGSAWAAWVTRHRAPAISLGVLWFTVAVLPVSNLLVPTGILLAERTLYLPSVGAALAVAGLVALVAELATHRQQWVLGSVAVLAGFALFVRTVDRNPSWFNSYTVLNTLAIEHPESYLAFRSRATGLAHVGEPKKAAGEYEVALRLVPEHYGLELEVGDFYGRQRDWRRAEEILRAAIAQEPRQPGGYRILAEQLLRRGQPRDGFLMALRGIARAKPTAGLWAAVSEAYIAKGDLEAAARARRAALALDPKSRHDWERLATILDHLHRPAEAARAEAHARSLPRKTDRPETPR